MSYSEQADFEEKINVLAQMRARFERYGMMHDISSANTLEIGGAGGILAGLLSREVKRVVVSDVVDSQTMYKGEFPSLLKAKFQRNSSDFEFKNIEFHVADAMDLPYKDNNFDLVVSQNAFEHIPDPSIALKEAVRVTNKGGLIYLTFDPVWTADSGSHFMNFVPEPWRHLICSTEKFCDEMRSAGASDYQLEGFRHWLNRKPASVYSVDFPKLLKSLKVEKFHVENGIGCVVESSRNHPNRFAAAKALGCGPDDLLIRAFHFCIKK
jgi:ubiquinone/menaquinone biosynthesis C-methylase UbiE